MHAHLKSDLPVKIPILQTLVADSRSRSEEHIPENWAGGTYLVRALDSANSLIDGSEVDRSSKLIRCDRRHEASRMSR